MKTNKHGLKMIGLKAATSSTKKASPYGKHIQISYDLSNGKIYAAAHNINL